MEDIQDSDPVTQDIPKGEKPSWTEVFAALDAAGYQDEFLSARNLSLPPSHDEIGRRDTSREQTATEERRTAKVFMSGRSQAVRIPADYRFTKNEVYIRRDPQTGDLILSEKPSWEEIFAELRAAKIPHDFFGDREQGEFEEREELL